MLPKNGIPNSGSVYPQVPRTLPLVYSESEEIQRLLELMPASGRMLTRLVSQPGQPIVIRADFPLPWHRSRPIYINFRLWQQLSQTQQDLLLLRTVSWLTAVQWFKPDWVKGLAIAGLVGTLVEGIQGDAVGLLTAGGLTALAGTQVWRGNRSPQRELEADETAVQVAERRGYERSQAAQSLMSAIETVAALERREQLNFTELLRYQNLRAIAQHPLASQIN